MVSDEEIKPCGYIRGHDDHLRNEIDRLKQQLAEADADRLVKQGEIERLTAEADIDTVATRIAGGWMEMKAENKRLRAYETAVKDFWVYIDGAPILDCRALEGTEA